MLYKGAAGSLDLTNRDSVCLSVCMSVLSLLLRDNILYHRVIAGSRCFLDSKLHPDFKLETAI